NSDMTLVAHYEIQDFIAVFDASSVNTYAYESTANYPFPADLAWDAERNATAQVVRLSDGTKLWTKDSGTPVVRNRESVVLAGINGLYQNGFDTRQIAFQYAFSTKKFTSATFTADMAAKNMANKNWKVQASTDGTTFTDLVSEGTSWAMTANVVQPISFALPAELMQKDLVTLRFVGVGDELLSSAYTVEGKWLDVDYYTHSESGIGNVYITGEAEVEEDPDAPVVTSTIPVDGDTGVSATGNITISYNERIEAGPVNTAATLNGETITPTWNSRSVNFQYVGLDYGKTYTFTMPAGYVQDKSGNTAEGVTLTFTVMDRHKPEARTFNAIVDASLDADKIEATADMPAQYKKIQDAINDAPSANEKPYLIYIKEGYYSDPNQTFADSYGFIMKDGTKVTIEGGKSQYDDCKIINVNKPNIHLIGQAVDKVTIASDRLDGQLGDGSRPWYHINAGATLEVQANGTDFYMENVTLDNENWTKLKLAGPQALAANVSADRAAFNNCNIRSYQDTYYNGGDFNRTFIHKSTIEGAVDFIYGSSDVWFEGCRLNINRDKGGYIVAPNHSQNVRWGYVFNNTVITTDYASDPAKWQVYLGRPWHNSPKTVFLHTQMELTPYAGYWYETMGGLPVLWAVYDIWDKNGNKLSEESIDTYYYIEDGQKITGKAKNYLTAEEVAEYTVTNVMAGDKTISATGYWNPLPIVEKTATPDVSANGNVASWEADEYAICYVVTVNGKAVAFPTEPIYTGKDGDVVTVQSVNEYGALSDVSEPVTLSSSTGISSHNADASDTWKLSDTIYNLSGQKVSANYRGLVIKGGKKVIVKVGSIN
ncbi:MAG: Ig-like domain-containing protein, partial [Bacteroidaceae bacterium]|nr:Ig-like domain-containing protein [Bacteroidaceae bacterium]